MNLASGIWNISSFDKVKVGKFHEPRFYKERKGFKSGLSVNIYADSDQSNLVIWSSDEWLSEYARNLDPRYAYYSPVNVLNRIFRNSMSVTILICSSRQRRTMNSKNGFSRAKPWNWDSWFCSRPYKFLFCKTMHEAPKFSCLVLWLCHVLCKIFHSPGLKPLTLHKSKSRFSWHIILVYCIYY